MAYAQWTWLRGKPAAEPAALLRGEPATWAPGQRFVIPNTYGVQGA